MFLYFLSGEVNCPNYDIRPFHPGLPPIGYCLLSPTAATPYFLPPPLLVCVTRPISRPLTSAVGLTPRASLWGLKGPADGRH
jgi:hypothetical protein